MLEAHGTGLNGAPYCNISFWLFHQLDRYKPILSKLYPGCSTNHSFKHATPYGLKQPHKRFLNIVFEYIPHCITTSPICPPAKESPRISFCRSLTLVLIAYSLKTGPVPYLARSSPIFLDFFSFFSSHTGVLNAANCFQELSIRSEPAWCCWNMAQYCRSY